MMKKVITLSLLSALITGARAADFDYLVFTLTDGTRQAVTASNLTITFSDGNLIAQSASETLATISLSTLSKMEFSETGTAGIHTLATGHLTIDNASAIYDMSGRLMPKNTTLPRGLYIIKGNGKTSKVQVK